MLSLKFASFHLNWKRDGLTYKSKKCITQSRPPVKTVSFPDGLQGIKGNQYNASPSKKCLHIIWH